MKHTKKRHSLNQKVKIGMTSTLLLVSALSGGIAGVGLQTLGAWPSWLGGDYYDQGDPDCSCHDYEFYHWITCPIKNLWGLNTTTRWSTPEIHEGTCGSHGHS
ncbi:hypothetical protein [Phaeocystidibacter luteus]|uniref:Uncharacterized protein n=1 Tax=Phaeocystidibacter luteus TaxID=911197 RepID=A0A6N6RGH0_9FLAO|nr:hypothetical protein [Phaeocystidibacter luteus]KAB2809838.1 hypothetical protein F8C67_09810 [Phaeocystidibacter luteus]